MPELSALAWAALVVAAVVVGVSKTAVPGAGTVVVALFATALPAKQSTGTLLLLLVADMFAIFMYRRHADWATLVRLIPAVLAGLALGVVFLALADDSGVRRVIGVILLVVILITLLRRAGQRPRAGRDEVTPEARRSRRIAAAAYGTLGGFTTMVANAGGPVMAMYFLAMRLPMKEFLGTAAWFFAMVNLSKVPFSIGLGLITGPGLLVDLVLVPLVVVGALGGRWIATRLNQRMFEWLVIGFTVIGAVYLLL